MKSYPCHTSLGLQDVEPLDEWTQFSPGQILRQCSNSPKLFGLSNESTMNSFDIPWFDRLMGRYFAELAGLAAMKLHTPVVAPGLLKTHPHPRTLGQGTFFVQKPRHIVWAVTAWLNWRAETVPAQRTAVTIAASNTALIFLVMIAPCFFPFKRWILAKIPCCNKLPIKKPISGPVPQASIRLEERLPQRVFVPPREFPQLTRLWEEWRNHPAKSRTDGNLTAGRNQNQSVTSSVT